MTDVVKAKSNKPIIIVVAVLVVLIVGVVAFNANSTKPTGGPAASATAPVPSTPAPVQGLKMTDVKEGSGAEAVPGKTVVVHYTGWLFDDKAADNKGTKFDSSRDRGDPFSFPLGGGRVIAG